MKAPWLVKFHLEFKMPPKFNKPIVSFINISQIFHENPFMTLVFSMTDRQHLSHNLLGGDKKSLIHEIKKILF